MVRNWFTLSTYFSPPTDLSDWISQAEAARLRGITRQAIAKLIKHHRLPTLEVGGRRFVSRTDVLSFAPLPAGRRKSEA